MNNHCFGYLKCHTDVNHFLKESELSCVKPTTMPPSTTRRTAAPHTTAESPHKDVPNRRHCTDDKGTTVDARVL